LPDRARNLQSAKAFMDWMRGEADLFTTTRNVREFARTPATKRPRLTENTRRTELPMEERFELPPE